MRSPEEVTARWKRLARLSDLTVGRRLLKIPLSVLIGTLAGIQTQPAVLAFAVEKTENDLPNVGYATVFPLAMIAKILFAQIVLQWGAGP